jgi:chromosome segregation ATPase
MKALSNCKSRILCAVILLATAAAQGDDVTAAKQALATAQNRLASASIQVQNLKLELVRAENQLRNAVNHVNVTSVNLQNVQVTLGDTRQLDQAAADAAAARQAVDEKSAESKTAREDLDASTAKVDEARAAAGGKFRASEACKTSDDAVRAAQQRLDDAKLASVARMQNDPNYVPLARDAESAERNVQNLREKNDPGLSDASGSSMQAKNRVGQFEEKWLGADESVTTAKAQLASAEQNQRKLLAKFDDDLRSDPQYLAASDERESKRRAFAAISAQLLQLTAEKESAEARQRSLQQRQDNAQQQVAADQIELQNSQANADQLGQQAQDLREKLRASMAAAQHDCDAAEALRKALQSQNH